MFGHLCWSLRWCTASAQRATQPAQARPQHGQSTPLDSSPHKQNQPQDVIRHAINVHYTRHTLHAFMSRTLKSKVKCLGNATSASAYDAVHAAMNAANACTLFSAAYATHASSNSDISTRPR